MLSSDGQSEGIGQNRHVKFDHDPSTGNAPIAIYQSIYNDITRTTESMSRSFDNDIQIGFDEIKHLHEMISQSCSQYNVKSANQSVTIYYSDETKDVFSTFEKFSKLSTGHASPVLNVILIYKLLIVPQLSDIPESYEISINICSRLTFLQHIKKKFGYSRSFSKIFKNDTINVRIKYFDYTIAKSVISLITDWSNNLPCAKTYSYIKFLQQHSNYFPSYGTFSVTIFSMIIIALFANSHFNNFDVNYDTLVAYLIVSSAIIYTFHRLAFWIGNYIENTINDWSAVSYLKLNKADEKQISLMTNNNTSIVKRTSFGFLTMILLPIGNKFVAGLLLAMVVAK